MARLAVDYALTIVRHRMRIGQIRRVGRRRLLLDLQKERILRSIPLKVNTVVAQPH